MKIEFKLIKWGIIFGFLRERGNFVTYLGIFLIAFINYAKLFDKTTLGT